jgi:two-component system, NarL family, sensor kinase
MEKISSDDLFKIITISTILLLAIGIFVAIYIALFKKKEMNLATQNLEQKKEFEATLLQTQIEIQEQTLKTISQEIHDNIGQILSLTKLTLSTIQATDIEVVNKINTTKTLINKAVIDLKDLSNSLNNDKVNDIGLVKSIENQVEIINKNKIKTTLAIHGNIATIDAKVELILFRIIQECLQNIVKHAQATTIDIAMWYSNNKYSINIKDNGKGFNINDTFNKGIGLKNIESRVKLINGTLNIDSSSKGTEVAIIINYSPLL